MISLPFKSNQTYGQLSQLEADEEKEQCNQSDRLPMSRRALLAHAILLLISSTLFVSSLFSYRFSSSIINEVDALLWSKELSSIPTLTKRFNGSFLFPSKFRGSSTEANKAWERFTLSSIIDGTAVVLGVTEADIRANNKMHDEDWFNSTVVLEEGNGGDTRYMATLEVFHQMHCLDMLRKATFRDEFKDDNAWKHGHVRHHLDHCLEILRQVVMCNSDPRLITFHWIKDNPVPYPDFNTWHQCRDVDATLEWGEKNAWPLEHTVKKKGGEIEMPEAP